MTCALQDSEVFEKAGVNVSVIRGALPDEVLKQMRTKCVGRGVKRGGGFWVGEIFGG